jgi:hypothetical protein
MEIPSLRARSHRSKYVEDLAGVQESKDDKKNLVEQRIAEQR